MSQLDVFTFDSFAWGSLLTLSFTFLLFVSFSVPLRYHFRVRVRVKIAGMEHYSSTPKDDQGNDALFYNEAKVERSLMYFASTNPSQKFSARTFPPWHSIPRSISVLVNKQPLII